MKLFYRALFAFFLTGLLYSCSSNNVHVRKDWEKYFSGQGITGSFMLHNSVLNTFEIYNLGGTQDRLLPAATFDIMNAMAGLETGIISDTNMVLRDSSDHPVAGIDPNLTLGEAFRRGSLPYFREVAHRVGRVKMQFWLDSVKYGNKTMGSGIDSFWLDNTLKISPDEQLGLLQELYYGKLPFQSRTQRVVKNLLVRDKTLNYTLAYKAGRGVAGGKQVGWIIGWIEKNGRPHFFVLSMEAPGTQKDLKALGFKIVHSILDEGGYFKHDE